MDNFEHPYGEKVDAHYLGRHVEIFPQPGSGRGVFSFFNPENAGSTICKKDDVPRIVLLGYRASKLLGGLEAEQIEDRVQLIDAAINKFFQDEAEFWLIQNGYTHEDEIPTREMDCATPENTSLLEALECCVDNYADREFQPARQHQLFATLALFHLDQAIYWHRSDRRIDEGVHVSPLVVCEILNATEALCFAEHIRIYHQRSQKTPATLHALLDSNSDKRKFRAEVDREAKERISQLNAENGRKGATAAHAMTNELKRFAIQLYQERNWISPNAAAKALVERIQEEAVRIGARKLVEDNAVRTVADWFRSVRRQKGGPCNV